MNLLISWAFLGILVKVTNSWLVHSHHRWPSNILHTGFYSVWPNIRTEHVNHPKSSCIRIAPPLLNTFSYLFNLLERTPSKCLQQVPFRISWSYDLQLHPSPPNPHKVAGTQRPDPQPTVSHSACCQEAETETELEFEPRHPCMTCGGLKWLHQTLAPAWVPLFPSTTLTAVKAKYNQKQRILLYSMGEHQQWECQHQ